MAPRALSEPMCPHCGGTLRMNHHYPVLTKRIMLSVISAKDAKAVLCHALVSFRSVTRSSEAVLMVNRESAERFVLIRVDVNEGVNQ
jgi:hypothetical protein